MADVLKKIIDANPFNQGSVTVTVGALGTTTGHILLPEYNATPQFITESGTLDSRFDDSRYYSGDTAS
jgi:hypothetical protein